MKIDIKSAYNDIETIKLLFTEYAKSLEVDLCFQDFNFELDTLPGKYAYPDGRLYLVYINDLPIGCIALRRYDETSSELKRLFLHNGYRGLGISKLLIKQVISDAKEIGYQRILLDTLNTMKSAIHVYKSFGFKEIEPYYDNPLDGATYFSLDLTK